MCSWYLQLSNGPVVGSRKRPSEGNYEKEKEHCIALFDQWSEAEQVEFVERLISRMCHYQHGHINSYLKPMLQRDFITALPGTNRDLWMFVTHRFCMTCIFPNCIVAQQSWVVKKSLTTQLCVYMCINFIFFILKGKRKHKTLFNLLEAF